MAIKVLIRRHFKENSAGKAHELLNRMRFEAMQQKGYISGETWINHYDPLSVTVVSTWQTVEDWIRWEESDVRASNESALEGILEAPTHFEIYDLGGSAEK